MNIKFTFKKELLALNSPFADLLFLATTTDAARYTNPDNKNEFIIESTTDEYLSLEQLKQILNQGVKVDGFAVFIKIPAEQYEDEVIAGLPDRED